MTKPPSIKFYDSKIFETDLKYFREWFRIQEKYNKDKFDYFYGPLDPDDQKSRDINRKRLERVKRRLSCPPRGRRSVRYSLSYSPPKRYDRSSQENRHSALQRYDVAIGDDAKQNESSTDQDINDYANFYMNFEEPKDQQGMNELMVFFDKLTAMITGPDHEYMNLKRLIEKKDLLKEQNNQKRKNKKKKSTAPAQVAKTKNKDDQKEASFHKTNAEQ
jgi:hypothetical protein